MSLLAVVRSQRSLCQASNCVCHFPGGMAVSDEMEDLVMPTHMMGQPQNRRLFGKGDSSHFAQVAFRHAGPHPFSESQSNAGNQAQLTHRWPSRPGLREVREDRLCSQRVYPCSIPSASAGLEDTKKSHGGPALKTIVQIDASGSHRFDAKYAFLLSPTAPGVASLSTTTSRLSSPRRSSSMRSTPRKRGRSFWDSLSRPRGQRSGLSGEEKIAAASSRCGWIYRQNDLRFMGGLLDEECKQNTAVDAFSNF